MPEEIRILGPDGRPVRKRELKREVARPTLAGIRQVWDSTSLAAGLTPERLAGLLNAAAQGDHYDYLTLAEEMEERDLHYASVLGTRKRAVSGLEPTVESATDKEPDVEMADAVRELARRSGFVDRLEDCLDALGKGYAAVEIVWETTARQWRPKEYLWRDPRYFRFDRDDGRTLRLLDEADSAWGLPLPPFKFIVHQPRLKSGIPIRGGLARLVAAAYLCKSYGVTDWLAFAEVFGMPLRVGRYGPGATESDIQTLIHAVANLGSDAAAVLPDSMRIEFEEPGNRTEGGKLFQGLATWLDKQVSKAVLGQTMTTDDGSSRAQAQVHDAVRLDILESDARQLANTINRDLVRPFIDLNFGPQENYPRLLLPVSQPEDTRGLAEVLEKLVPLGLEVEASVIRDRLGLPDPEEGADLLEARPPQAVQSAGARAISQAGASEATDAVEAELDRMEREALDGWEEQIDPVLAPILALARKSQSFAEFRAGLTGLLEEMDDRVLVERLARACFAVRGMGDATDAA